MLPLEVWDSVMHFLGCRSLMRLRAVCIDLRILAERILRKRLARRSDEEWMSRHFYLTLFGEKDDRPLVTRAIVKAGAYSLLKDTHTALFFAIEFHKNDFFKANLQPGNLVDFIVAAAHCRNDEILTFLREQATIPSKVFSDFEQIGFAGAGHVDKIAAIEPSKVNWPRVLAAAAARSQFKVCEYCMKRVEFTEDELNIALCYAAVAGCIPVMNKLLTYPLNVELAIEFALSRPGPALPQTMHYLFGEYFYHMPLSMSLNYINHALYVWPETMTVLKPYIDLLRRQYSILIVNIQMEPES